MQITSACNAIGGDAIGEAAPGRAKVWASSLGGKLLRVRELTGQRRRRGEDEFVKAAAPWLRKLLGSALAGRVLAENKGDELDRDEAWAAAWRGLGEAMASWDPERCPSFVHYARWRVLGELAKTSRAALVVAGVRPRCLDEVGESEDGGGVDVVDEAATPEQAVFVREEAAEEAARLSALRQALAALSPEQRAALEGRATRAKAAALAALRAELRRLGVEGVGGVGEVAS